MELANTGQRYDFKPRFARGDVAGLVCRYRPDNDLPALAAGDAIRRGEFRFSHLRTIFQWKTGGRGKSRLEKNSDAEVEDALRLAVGATTSRAAIAVLTGLSGVQVPVASAVMTAINPKVYTVIDFRALHALSVQTEDRTVGFYLVYLDACRKLAADWNIPLRDFDRALWQWSAEHASELLG